MSKNEEQVENWNSALERGITLIDINQAMKNHFLDKTFCSFRKIKRAVKVDG